MKNIYLTLMLLLALPLTVLSQPALSMKAVPQTKHNLPAITNQIESVNQNLSHEKVILPQLMGTYKVMDTTIDVVFNSLYDGNTPLTYEPKSHTLFFVQTNRGLVAKTDDRLTGFVYLYWSQDNGATWSRETIYGNKLDEAKGMVPVNMSVAVLNPTNSSNPAEFSYIVFGRLFKYNATTKKYDTKGGFYLLGQNGGFDKFDPFEEEGPSTNNPGAAQVWLGTKMFASNAGTVPYIYAYGTLTPKPNQQYGMYGFAYAGLKSGSFEDFGSIMPPAWVQTNWRATGDFNSSYNGPIYIDADEEGTLYAAVNNIFADDQDHRVISISKSTDHGKTWSAFDRMPNSVVDNYLQLNGYQSGFQPKPYNTSGFVVTGKDKFSYVCTFRNVISESASTFNDMFVEIYKENGAWGIRQIASNSGDKWRTPWLLSDTTNEDIDTIIIDGFDDNPRGYEIQLAKTADGGNLVLKYIDNRKDLGVLNPKVTLANSFTVDSILTTDIYYSYRSTSSTQWSVARTITDDQWNNKVTWIPNIIPSINEIPIVEHVTVKFTNPLNQRVINKYPYWLQNYVTDAGVRNLILWATFNAQGTDLVRNESIQNTTTSVDDQLMPSFQLFNISPNPVSGDASVSFNLDIPSNVKIELFNALGQKVKVIFDTQLMNPGVSAVNFNVSELSVGTYFYTMTANGRATTKIMNVVR